MALAVALVALVVVALVALVVVALVALVVVGVFLVFLVSRVLLVFRVPLFGPGELSSRSRSRTLTPTLLLSYSPTRSRVIHSESLFSSIPYAVNAHNPTLQSFTH